MCSDRWLACISHVSAALPEKDYAYEECPHEPVEEGDCPFPGICNEFIIIENRRVVCPEISITIDHDAEGTLNEVLKGSVSLQDAQMRYTKAIETGLQTGALVQVENRVIVAAKKGSR